MYRREFLKKAGYISAASPFILSGCAEKPTSTEYPSPKPATPLNIQTNQNFQDQNDMPELVIDAHAHLIGRIQHHSEVIVDYDGAAHIALATMDKLSINKTLVMPQPFPPEHPNKYDVDDFIDTVRKYPDRFARLGGGGTLNPMIQQTVYGEEVKSDLRKKFEEKAQEVLAKGAIGFGEMTAEHLSFFPKHPYESAPPDHSLFLLLTDIAASHDVPIVIHMEAVLEEMPLPIKFSSPPNPEVLHPNIVAFERLLDYNRKAKIIWSHAGWDNTGYRSVELCGELLSRHPNLYMSIKIIQNGRPKNYPLDNEGRIKAEWLKLISTFSDRFILGSDQFYVTPKIRKRIGPYSVERTVRFLSNLPLELARKVGYENAKDIYRLDK